MATRLNMDPAELAKEHGGWLAALVASLVALGRRRNGKAHSPECVDLFARAQITDVKDEMKELKDEQRRATRVLYRIAGRLDVPVEEE